MKDQMKGAYNFSIDVVSGDKGEKTIIDFLKLKRGLSFVRKSLENEEESLSDFDILMKDKNGKKFTFEIKTDLYCTSERDTGNMAIEHRRKGFNNEDEIQPTGIRKTKADFYIYYYWNLNSLWIIPTSRLKQIIRDLIKEGAIEAPGGRRHKWMGDNRRSLSYLIPREKYKTEFSVFSFKREELYNNN